MRVLNQQNFSVKNYLAIVTSAFDLMQKPYHNQGVQRKHLPVRDDLDFWVNVVMFVPRIEFNSEEEVISVQAILMEIDEELVEVDFSRLIFYL